MVPFLTINNITKGRTLNLLLGLLTIFRVTLTHTINIKTSKAEVNGLSMNLLLNMSDTTAFAESAPLNSIPLKLSDDSITHPITRNIKILTPTLKPNFQLIEESELDISHASHPTIGTKRTPNITMNWTTLVG